MAVALQLAKSPMELEHALQKLNSDEATPQPAKHEWSPLPFGRAPLAANDDDEPLSFTQKLHQLKSASQP